MHYQVPVSECRLLSPAVFNLFIKQRVAIYIQQQETEATSEKKLNGMNGGQRAKPNKTKKKREKRTQKMKYKYIDVQIYTLQQNESHPLMWLLVTL